MNSDSNTPPNMDSNDETEPIPGLRDLEHDSTQDFVGRVRRKIHRRRATAQAATFSWHMPGLVLIEMADLLKHFVATTSNRKDPLQ